MKKKISMIAVLIGLVLAGPSLLAVYKVKQKEAVEKPSFASPQEEKIYRLDHGEILTNGGYLKKGVWGRMEGVVEAPPIVVWRLFIQANEWKKYGLPSLADSRALSEEVALQSKDMKKVEELYAVIGNRVFDATQNQVTGTIWTNYTLQYYDLPWPIADKWMVLKNRNDEKDADKGIYRSEWEKLGGNVNSINGKIRVEPFQGDKNRTWMEYSIESDPGSSVPKFLLKWGVKRTMPAAIRVIRRETAKILGRPAPLLKTQ